MHPTYACDRPTGRACVENSMPPRLRWDFHGRVRGGHGGEGWANVRKSGTWCRAHRHTHGAQHIMPPRPEARTRP
eukprot:5478937-Prymnesium_polylepis.2